MSAPKKASAWPSLVVLSLLLLGAFAFIAPNPVSASTTASCNANTDPFSITGVTWGTATSPQSVYPGDQDVPLTVSLLFSGPCDSPQTTFQLLLSQANNPNVFSGLDGNTQPQVVAVNTNANSLVSETFYLDVSLNAPTGTGVTYEIPMSIQYSSNNASNPITQSVTVPVSLYGAVELNFASTTTNLPTGETDNVTFSISNTGTGSSGQITTTITAPSTVTILDQPSAVQSLGAGSNVSRSFEVLVPSSLSGTSVTLTLTAKYLDAYENSQTATQDLVFAAGGSASSASFLVWGSNWGTTASPTSPLPGSQDTPLVVSLQYLGSAPVASLQGTIQLPTGITNFNGGTVASAYSAGITNQYGSVSLTFYLDIANTVQSGNYNFTLALDWMTSQSSGLTQTTLVTPPPIAQLQTSFLIVGSEWERSSNSSLTATAASPEPGSSDTPLVISLQFIGTTPVTGIEGSLALPGGITDLNGDSTAIAYAATASSGQVVTLTFDLNIGSSVKPGSYNYTLGVSWLTSVFVEMKQTSDITPPPIAATTAASFPLSVTQQNSTVVSGSQDSAAFTLTNEGTATIYSPTFSLNVGSPVVLTSIGSSVPTSSLAPGKTVSFTAYLTGGPSASPGIYGGTLSVVFTDSSGTSHTQTFPVSFTLEGTVIFVLQDTEVSQTATGFTITGSILDEGSVSAYYASIGGLLDTSSATPVYLGEIDPDTPVPFSVTIPFAAPLTVTSSTSGNSTTTSTTFSFTRTGTVTATRTGSFSFTGAPGGAGGFPGVGAAATGAAGAATISLTLSYKDTFGDNQTKAFPLTTTIKSASQLSTGTATAFNLGTTSSTSDSTYVAYGVVAFLAATLVVGAVMLRKHRARRLASLPPEARGEQTVI